MSSKKLIEGEKDIVCLFGEDTLYIDGDIQTVAWRPSSDTNLNRKY